MLQLHQSNVLELYQARAQETLDNYNDRTTRQKYAKSEAYVSFRQAIYVGHANYRILDSCAFDTALRKYSIQTRRCRLWWSSCLEVRKPTTQVSVLIIDLMDQRRETVAMTMTMTFKLAAFSRISIAP